MQNLLDKYWQGKATKEEIITLYHLIKESDETLRQELEATFYKDLATGSYQNIPDMESLLMLIKKQVIPLPEDHSFPSRLPSIKRQIFRYTAAAAVTIAVFSACLFFTKTPPANLLSEKPVSLVQQQPRWKIIFTTRQDSLLTMPDSSMVTIAANSVIKYDTGYNSSHRLIYLEKGSLSAAVQKNRQLPFSVKAGNTETIAVGTIFSVKKNKDQSVLIHLIEGLVNVKQELPRQETVTHKLRAGDKLWISDAINKLTPETIHAPVLKKPEPAAVVPHPLSFNQENLQTIITTLEQHFDVKIICNEQVRQTTWFSGAFKTTDNVTHILEMICLINELELTRHNEKEFEIKSLN